MYFFLTIWSLIDRYLPEETKQNKVVAIVFPLIEFFPVTRSVSFGSPFLGNCNCSQSALRLTAAQQKRTKTYSSGNPSRKLAFWDKKNLDDGNELVDVFLTLHKYKLQWKLNYKQKWPEISALGYLTSII